MLRNLPKDTQPVRGTSKSMAPFPVVPHCSPTLTCCLTKDVAPEDSVFTVTALAKGQQKAQLLFLSFLVRGKEIWEGK